MENFEKVEKIREKANVSYEEAKGALEACNYDMLDAMVYLEKLGKVAAPNVNNYTTSSPVPYNQAEFNQAQQTYANDCRKQTFGDMLSKFFTWLKKVIKKGCDTTFSVDNPTGNVFRIPVIVLAAALIFAFPITIVALIVGMFLDCRYSFLGFESTSVSVDINEMCNKASDVCGNIKNDFMKSESNAANNNDSNTDNDNI